MAHTDKVLISGAGPAGLVLALALRRNGLNVRIIDRVLAPRVGERGAAVSARSLELHKILGTLPEIMAVAGQFPTMQEHDPKDPFNVLRTFDFMPVNETNANAPWRNYVVIGQNHHERILRDYLEICGTFVQFGSELRTFTQHDDRVTAEISKRDSIGKETIEVEDFAWIVGADGARSVVRKTLGVSFLGETKNDQEAVVADLRMKSPRSEFWELWGSRETKFLLQRPSSQDRDVVSIILMGTVDGDQLVKDPVALVDELSAITGRQDIQFGEVIWSSKYRPNIRMVDTLRVGRVLLTGDAAHCHSPAGGQGLNSSIQDSFNLAWKLALVHKGIAEESLLDTYGEERLPVIAQMLNKTSELLKYTLSDPNGAATHWSTEAEIRQDMNQLGVNYRGSSVLYYEPTERNVVISTGTSYNRASETDALPGDRAPDAPGLLQLGATDSTNLFDIFSPSLHTVLVFADPYAAVADLTHIINATQSQPSDTVQLVHIVKTHDQGALWGDYPNGPTVILVDEHGHAFNGYNIQTKAAGLEYEAPRVVIVRPDGVIGARFRGSDGIAHYFNGIFNGAAAH